MLFHALHRLLRLAPLLAATLVVPASLAFGQQADYGGYRPHYQGFGTATSGGRSGTIYKVTNLNDSGPGSLRAALTEWGPRFVLFEVSGTIALKSPIFINAPFVTVAGQTAPSPGITVRNHPIFIDTNDVVFQHLRLRLGDTACDNDCVMGGSDVVYIRNNAFNIVLDHLSVSWGTHGGIDVNAWNGQQPRDITILDCIVSENLAKRPNPFATGTILMPSQDGTATFARNLHAHNGNRSPWVSPGWQFSGYNNVAYNAGSVARDEGTLAFFQLMGGYGYGGAFDAVWVNNVAIAGPNTDPDGKAVKLSLPAGELGLGNKLYMEGNVGPHQTPENQWGGVTYLNAATEAATRSGAPAWWHGNFSYAVMPTPEVTSYVLANAGARPLDRDTVDQRIVQEVVNRTGGRIRTPLEVGGYPVLAEVRRPLVVPANPHEVVVGSRTRIEVWLEAFARALEPGHQHQTTLSAPQNLRAQ